MKTREEKLATNKQWRENMRFSLIDHYSKGKMVCACCGEGTYIFLTLDHINNNGTSERKKYAGGGHQHYRWIIKNGMPDGYQVLCYNCNCGRAKTEDKKCPHELEK